MAMAAGFGDDVFVSRHRFLSHIYDVITRAVLDEDVRVVKNVEAVLRGINNFDFEHSILALSLTDDADLVSRACKTVEMYSRAGLKLRYSNLDAYYVLLLYMLERNRFRSIDRSCAENLVNVLENNLEELEDEIDRVIARAVIDIAKTRLHMEGQNMQRILRRYTSTCRTLKTKPYTAFCIFSLGVVAHLCRAPFDFSIMVKNRKDVERYLRELQSPLLGECEAEYENMSYPSLLKYYIYRRGLQILEEVKEMFSRCRGEARGIIYGIITFSMFVLILTIRHLNTFTLLISLLRSADIPYINFVADLIAWLEGSTLTPVIELVLAMMVSIFIIKLLNRWSGFRNKIEIFEEWIALKIYFHNLEKKGKKAR